MNRWWVDRPEERYWLEVTDRADLGVDLRAPLVADDGNPSWSYSLVREVAAGDTVFHYSSPDGAIVGISRATGDPWEEELIRANPRTTASPPGIQSRRLPSRGEHPRNQRSR